MSPTLVLLLLCISNVLGLRPHLASLSSSSLRTTNFSTIYNVLDYGAVGNGQTDDTAAIQAASKISVASGGVLYFPSGYYRVTSTIYIVPPSSAPFEISGDGFSSDIMWTFDGHLFSISPTGSNQVAEMIFRDLRLTSMTVPKTPTNAAIYCEDCVRSLFQDLIVDNGDANYPASGIIMDGTADTNTVRDCQFWNIKGTGVQIGMGSEVRIFGGRIVGDDSRNDGSIGVHVTGNNGGVHIDSVDIIALQTGVLLDNASGAGSNRETFITHSTMDSNWRGLAIADNSYVSVAGLWASSCDQDNIWIAGGGTAILVIAGGTLFNAGVYGCSDPSSACNGLTANSGTFILNGVEVRNNQGRGIWVPNGAVNEYVVQGCRIFANGQGMNLAGDQFVVSNNVCGDNANPNAFGGSNSVITNNVGC